MRLHARSLPLALPLLLAIACGGGGGAATPATECQAGATRSCYSGPAGVLGVGVCHAGLQTCTAAGAWPAACAGEVLPGVEQCGNGLDDDCNGTVDESSDLDGDGWTACGGDCCEVAGPGCPDPVHINPGAFDVPGNGVDDDCNGTVDDVAVCDAGLAADSADAADYARALEVCAASDGRTAGLRSAGLLLADGTQGVLAIQHALPARFGGILPEAGGRLALLSTGAARALGDPGFVAFQPGLDCGTTAAAPADWLSANGGAFPTAPGCPGPGATTVKDSAMLRLVLKVPTNARSFSLRTFFLSSEFPEWTCSAFNDLFVVLLDSSWAGSPANPADKNLATFTGAGGTWPVGVNLATGGTGLFTACTNGAIGCESGAVPGTISTCTTTAPLAGTGFDVAAPACSAGDTVGGGTGWLTVRGNVVPGEIITLRIALWDTGDHLFDSVAVLDAFAWSTDTVTPGLTP